MKSKWLVLDTSRVGNIYFGRDRQIARVTYSSWAAVGHAVGLYEIKGQERLIVSETARFRAWRLNPTATERISSDSTCIRCAEEIPVSGTVPAVDLDGRPVCQACEAAEKAQARATWLRGVVPA
jgi:hypothetical protein